MTKIKDTPIAGKLPQDCKYCDKWDSEEQTCKQADELVDKYGLFCGKVCGDYQFFQLDIDINEVACVDVRKVYKIMAVSGISTVKQMQEAAKTIAKSALRWKTTVDEDELQRCPDCGQRPEEGACFYCKKD